MSWGRIDETFGPVSTRDRYPNPGNLNIRSTVKVVDKKGIVAYVVYFGEGVDIDRV